VEDGSLTSAADVDDVAVDGYLKRPEQPELNFYGRTRDRIRGHLSILAAHTGTCRERIYAGARKSSPERHCRLSVFSGWVVPREYRHRKREVLISC